MLDIAKKENVVQFLAFMVSRRYDVSRFQLQQWAISPCFQKLCRVTCYKTR